MSLTYAGKFAIGKERPDGSNNLGFPSAHTSSAFSGASFLAKRYGWDIGVPAYLAASFVGFSRVHANKHDWWDVTAGAALAMGINEWLVRDQSDLNVALLPVAGGAQLAFSIRY
nr:phosphatase PAP2 family protein [Reinekea sp. G2M2-21]